MSSTTKEVCVAFVSGIAVSISAYYLYRSFSISPSSDISLTDAEGIESTIGNTPLFVIKSLSEATGCTILAKAEFLNGAGGSPKDRVALSIINKAEKRGLLSPFSGIPCTKELSDPQASHLLRYAGQEVISLTYVCQMILRWRRVIFC